jgi:hypothetical protein
MVDKFLAQIDAKLDAIIEKLGIQKEEIRAQLHEATAPTQEMSAAEKQAVANAPATPAARPKVTPPSEGEAAPVTPAADEPEATSVPRNRR